MSWSWRRLIPSEYPLQRLIEELNARLLSLSNSLAQGLEVRTVTASETLDREDKVMLVDTSSGAVTLSLLPAAQLPGVEYHIKLIDATNNLTIDPDGSETIDGSTTLVVSTVNVSYSIVSDGAQWWIV